MRKQLPRPFRHHDSPCAENGHVDSRQHAWPPTRQGNTRPRRRRRPCDTIGRYPLRPHLLARRRGVEVWKLRLDFAIINLTASQSRPPAAIRFGETCRRDHQIFLRTMADADEWPSGRTPRRKAGAGFLLVAQLVCLQAYSMASFSPSPRCLARFRGCLLATI